VAVPQTKCEERSYNFANCNCGLFGERRRRERTDRPEPAGRRNVCFGPRAKGASSSKAFSLVSLVSVENLSLLLSTRDREMGRREKSSCLRGVEWRVAAKHGRQR